MLTLPVFSVTLFIVQNSICARSSVDRAQVSGTWCVGSIPTGRTIITITPFRCFFISPLQTGTTH